jgi:hypothetical protein
MFEGLMRFKDGEHFTRISGEARARIIELAPVVIGVLEQQNLISKSEKLKLASFVNQQINEPFLTTGSPLVSFILKLTGNL